jgi:hypothetical protein
MILKISYDYEDQCDNDMILKFSILVVFKNLVWYDSKN